MNSPASASSSLPAGVDMTTYLENQKNLRTSAGKAPTDPHHGVLVVRVMEGKGMVVADETADPYCIVKLVDPSGNVLHKKQTSAKANNENPQWEEYLAFDINSSLNSHHLDISVYDRDTFTKDDLIGTAQWNFSPSARDTLANLKIVEFTVDLDIKTKSAVKGTVRLAVFFMPHGFEREYETWPASKKQDFLWSNRILPSRHAELPPIFTRVLTVGMAGKTYLEETFVTRDWFPLDRPKAIHIRGCVTKVKFVPEPGHPYGGILKGASHGLARFSLAVKPESGGFMPGVGLKFLRDGAPSANILMMGTTLGFIADTKTWDFFKNDFSHVIPIAEGFLPTIVQAKASIATKHPTHLSITDFVSVDEEGRAFDGPKPIQICCRQADVSSPLAPGEEDIRQLMCQIQPDTVLFHVWAKGVDSKEGPVDGPWTLVGALITTSEVITSEFADQLLKFTHAKLHGE